MRFTFKPLGTAKFNKYGTAAVQSKGFNHIKDLVTKPKWDDHADFVPNNEFVLFKKDISTPLKSALLNHGAIEHDTGYALPANTSESNSARAYGRENLPALARNYSKRFNIPSDEIEQSITNGSVVPYVDKSNDHFAILDAPFDMEKELTNNKYVTKSNRGTYFVKIPKSLHALYKDNAKGMVDRNGKQLSPEKYHNRANYIILKSIGIDPLKTNKGSMRITVANTLSPEDIENMKSR